MAFGGHSSRSIDFGGPPHSSKTIMPGLEVRRAAGFAFSAVEANTGHIAGNARCARSMAIEEQRTRHIAFPDGR